MSIELKKLIRQDTSDLKARVEWRDGIFLEIRFVRKSELEIMARNCRTHKYNKDTHTRAPELDYKKFLRALCERVVTGWDGVTLEKLNSLMSLEVPEASPEKMKEVIPFTQDNLEAIIQETSDLDKLISDVCVDASYFKDVSLEDVLTKNSKPSPSGS